MPLTPAAASDFASVRRRLAGDARVRVALAVLVVIALAALLAPLLAPYDPTAQLDIVKLQGRPPSFAHPFGTDPFSRDVLSRMLYGSRVSLSIAFIAVTLAMTFGTVVGMVAGYFGGVIDAVLMRLVDAAFSIPTLLVVIVVIALWGEVSIFTLTLLIAGLGWFTVSRLVRAETLALRDAEFVLAARALGTSAPRILWRHVLPNVIAPALVASTLAIGNVILLEAGLSFLGIGVRPPAASWGSIIQDGADRVGDLWWVTVFPGAAIVLTAFACNALGDALREALDPRQLDSALSDSSIRTS